VSTCLYIIFGEFACQSSTAHTFGQYCSSRGKLLGGAGGNYRGWHKQGVFCPVMQCGDSHLDDSSDLPMDRMPRLLTSPGIRTANGFLAEHWRSVGSPCPVAL